MARTPASERRKREAKAQGAARRRRVASERPTRSRVRRDISREERYYDDYDSGYSYEDTGRERATGRMRNVRVRRQRNRRMIITITVVVLMFCVVIGIQIVQKYSTLSSLKKEKAKLEAQYAKQLNLADELKKQEKYVKTDAYVEEMARRLGLLYPDEVIFKPEE